MLTTTSEQQPPVKCQHRLVHVQRNSFCYKFCFNNLQTPNDRLCTMTTFWGVPSVVLAHKFDCTQIMFCSLILSLETIFQELLMTLATTVSKGGNLLVNVGPTKEGTIDPVMQERLEQLGQWLRINGEAVCLFTNYNDFHFKSIDKQSVY